VRPPIGVKKAQLRQRLGLFAFENGAKVAYSRIRFHQPFAMTRPSPSLTWCITLAVVVCCASAHSQQPTTNTPQPKYNSREISFKTFDDLPMSGRLVLPRTNPPRAIVIYVQTAEGATIDQKRPLGGGKTFNYYDVYRDKLPPMNVGFFSYEGRGISMGDAPPRYEKIDWPVFNTGTLENKIRDLLSAIEIVRRQEGLQRTPILLLGCSEGTLLAVEATSRKPDSVAGLVLYGVAASNLRQILTHIFTEGYFMQYRSLDENKDGAISKEEWDKRIKSTDFSRADLNGDGKFDVDDVKIMLKKSLDAIANNDYEVLQESLKAGAATLPQGWVKDHFAHAEMWSFVSKLKMPIGCFQGDADANVPIAAVKELEAKAKKANLTNMEFHYFEGLDHSLGIGQYFVNGKLPAGHQAIFEYIDRIAPKN